MEVDGESLEVELLKSFEFNSDRKRMSVIIKQNGVVGILFLLYKIKIYVKGADSIIKSRLSSRHQPFLSTANDRLDFFSKKGLRTLCLAMKVLTEDEYVEFDRKLNNCLG